MRNARTRRALRTMPNEPDNDIHSRCDKLSSTPTFRSQFLPLGLSGVDRTQAISQLRLASSSVPDAALAR
ncbi:hypothetical protein PISMIDRAFT_672796 [Pisolithus microcarpus 441]|uniref:Uncharacterized protein n=1 Tax=Pisolithus microcarpus 441 TaxID=765257 RepID=A0A0C9ZJ42_9AGAM|nr:hypothetical protein PISMIDRAFT_672796 [Pisolithus microcarpus 441]